MLASPKTKCVARWSHRMANVRNSGRLCGQLHGMPHKLWKVPRCNYLYHLCSIGLWRIKCQRAWSNVREELVRLLQYIKWHFDFHLANKRQLNQLLCSFSHGHNINMVGRENCLLHHNEAEITLVSWMLKFAEKVVAHVLMEKWDRSVIDINTMLSLHWH